MYKAIDNRLVPIEVLPQAIAATAAHRLVKVVAALDKNTIKPKWQKLLKTIDIKTAFCFCNFTI